MAVKKSVESLNINNTEYGLSVWDQLGISKLYFLSLLGRDEYTPTLEKQPDESTVLYIDPASGNPANFHVGQCAVYPSAASADGIGISIVKKVVEGDTGLSTKVYWLHLTEIMKAMQTDIDNKVNVEICDSQYDFDQILTKNNNTIYLIKGDQDVWAAKDYVDELFDMMVDLRSRVTRLESDNYDVPNGEEPGVE